MRVIRRLKPLFIENGLLKVLHGYDDIVEIL